MNSNRTFSYEKLKKLLVLNHLQWFYKSRLFLDFSLKWSTDSALIFSFIGCKTWFVDVLSIYHIKFRISSNPLGLDEAAQNNCSFDKSIFVWRQSGPFSRWCVLVVVSLSLQYMELANYIDSMSEIGKLIVLSYSVVCSFVLYFVAQKNNNK